MFKLDPLSMQSFCQKTPSYIHEKKPNHLYFHHVKGFFDISMYKKISLWITITVVFRTPCTISFQAFPENTHKSTHIHAQCVAACRIMFAIGKVDRHLSFNHRKVLWSHLKIDGRHIGVMKTWFVVLEIQRSVEYEVLIQNSLTRLTY